MGQPDRLHSLPVVEARACAPACKGATAGVRVYLRRVSPRGAMVQGGDLPDHMPGGVMLLAAAGAARPALPRWRFARPEPG